MGSKMVGMNINFNTGKTGVVDEKKNKKSAKRAEKKGF
jgi:hypothetical protein